MEAWKPGNSRDLTCQGISGQDFQSYKDEKQWPTEADKIVRKNRKSSQFSDEKEAKRNIQVIIP